MEIVLFGGDAAMMARARSDTAMTTATMAVISTTTMAAIGTAAMAAIGTATIGTAAMVRR